MCKNVQRLQKPTCSGHKTMSCVMLLLLQKCMSLSLWVTCYCLCGLAMSFIFPSDSYCKHKDHLQKNNKLKSFKKPTDTSVCTPFIYYMAIKQKGNVSLRNQKQINIVCAISRTTRGGRRNCSSKASVCVDAFLLVWPPNTYEIIESS